jgi:hypothetical protein
MLSVRLYYNRPRGLHFCCLKWPLVGPQNKFYNRHSVYNFVDSLAASRRR